MIKAISCDQDIRTNDAKPVLIMKLELDIEEYLDMKVKGGEAFGYEWDSIPEVLGNKMIAEIEKKLTGDKNET